MYNTFFISFLLQLKNSLKVYCLIIEVKVFIYFYLIYSYKLTNAYSMSSSFLYRYQNYYHTEYIT